MKLTHLGPMVGALAAAALLAAGAGAQTDPLPSWNEGSAKVAIV